MEKNVLKFVVQDLSITDIICWYFSVNFNFCTVLKKFDHVGWVDGKLSKEIKRPVFCEQPQSNQLLIAKK